MTVRSTVTRAIYVKVIEEIDARAVSLTIEDGMGDSVHTEIVES
jgi:hypothetical protein